MRRPIPFVRFLFPSVLVLATVLAAGAQAPAGDDGPSSARAWRGILPDPEPTLEAEHFVCRVVDDATGEPVAGARLVRTPERIAPWHLRHDVPLGVAYTDAMGVAWLPTTGGRWEDECHWLVTAAGYGFAYEYGKLAPVEMRLRPETRVHGRVVDALGRPVPGARVEALGGCSHGTAAVSAVTDAGGTFVLRGIDPSLPGQLWVAGPDIAADLIALDGPETLGRRGVLLTMETGVRYRGRVVDLLGNPIQRAVVRAHNEQRGPATATAADGTFVLDGVEETRGFTVFSPGDLGPDGDRYVSDVVPEIRCTLVASPLGIAGEEASGSLRVRAQDADGHAVGGLACAILSMATGRGPLARTADAAEAGLEVGELLEEVAAGPWRIVPTDPLSSHTFDPIEVEVGTEAVDLSVHAQARLQILGEVPEDADCLLLAVPGAATTILDTVDDPLPYLPVAGAASLRVDVHGRPPFFFPVGPVIDGIRTAHVELPPPRCVVLPNGARAARLADGEREAYHRVDEQAGVILTDASGPLTLTYEDAEGAPWTLEVVVQDDPGGVVVVDAAAARIVMPEADEAEDVASGPCVLTVTVEDVDGPVDAIVLVGDALHAAPAGTLTVRRLGAGPLRVVVARRDVVGEGRVFDLVLVAGEPSVVKADLPLE